MCQRDEEQGDTPSFDARSQQGTRRTGIAAPLDRWFDITAKYVLSSTAGEVKYWFTPLGGSTITLDHRTNVNTLLNTAASGEAIHALILLTDGHDFELINPVKTGAAARARLSPGPRDGRRSLPEAC